MPIILDNNEAAIRRGIKTVGVGKKGSKALSQELAREILADLKAGKVTAAAQGSFWAGLLAKGLE
ncbi:MAG: anthranilate phosphoribosyltransferase, partial [Candidatus Omnitrophica bacterium]|nr:anthranilate phosphoribosyltransferase [Candidatus Omnitrophota bacterium]